MEQQKLSKLKKLKKMQKVKKEEQARKTQQEKENNVREDLNKQIKELGTKAMRQESQFQKIIKNKDQLLEIKAKKVPQLSRNSSQMSHKAQPRMQDGVIDHPKALENCKVPIFRICLTGGPCAGKTTALASLSNELQTRGYFVLQVPEAATMLMKGGAFI